MKPRGKQKFRKGRSNSSSTHQGRDGRGGRDVQQQQQQQQHQRKAQPKIVEEIDDSDDEEIDEDEAFNSEDERLYGHFFAKQNDKDDGRADGKKNNNKKNKGKASISSADHDGDNDEEEDDDEDVTSADENLGSSDDEDISDDDDDEDEEDDDDGGQYMLDLLNKLDDQDNNTTDDKAREKISLAQMVKIPESDYSNSISKTGLTLDNLMEGIQDTAGFRELQKNFAKQQKATPAPLGTVAASRVERRIAYQATVKDISRWTKAIQENRQAESLDFKPKDRLQLTRDTLVDKFEARTDFEKEIEQALEEAGRHDEEAVLKAEEDALQDDLGANRLTMEEYKKRRGQLAQIRALMFYHEQKRHHMNKIKSKKYRRIRKKQRERLKESELEAAMEEDDGLANELKEKEEVARIQERMTLAHKNTSKWAKRILKRGKNVDVDTRRALSAQLTRGDTLRRKMMGEEDDDDNSANDSDSEDLVETARKVLQDTEEESDPTHGKTGLFKLSFMQKGIQKQREQARMEALKLLGELEANEVDDYDAIVETNDDEENKPRKEVKIASAKEMKKVLEKGELVAAPLEFGNSNSIATSGGIEIDLGPIGDEARNENDSHSKEEAVLSPQLDVPRGEFTSTLQVTRGSVAKPSSETTKQKPNSNATKKRKTSASMATTRSTEPSAEEDNPWMILPDDRDSSKKSLSDDPTKPASKKAKLTGIVDIEAAVDLLDSTDQPMKGGVLQGEQKTTDRNDGPQKIEEKKISMLSQEELVRKAFVRQDVQEIEEEFQREKEAMAAENDPTRRVEKDKKSDDVAGWGSWTGQGTLPSLPRKFPKKLQAPKKKKEETKNRLDDSKPDVIINQKRLKKTANNFMLGDVPHPYSSRVEYEQAMLGGVGKEWNVSSSFKSMTRPEILTRSGKIIKPISKKAKQPRPAAKF